MIFDYFRSTSEAFDVHEPQTLIFHDRSRKVHPVFESKDVMTLLIYRMRPI